jgi:hypothetical protein
MPAARPCPCRDENEVVVAQLMYQHLLTLDFGITAYATNVYLKACPRGLQQLKAGTRKVLMPERQGRGQQQVGRAVPGPGAPASCAHVAGLWLPCCLLQLLAACCSCIMALAAVAGRPAAGSIPQMEELAAAQEQQAPSGAAGAAYHSLEAARQLLARQHNVYTHAVLPSGQMLQLAQQRPGTLAELQQVTGASRAQEFGAALLAAIQGQQLPTAAGEGGGGGGGGLQVRQQAPAAAAGRVPEPAAGGSRQHGQAPQQAGAGARLAAAPSARGGQPGQAAPGRQRRPPPAEVVVISDDDEDGDYGGGGQAQAHTKACTGGSSSEDDDFEVRPKSKRAKTR